MTALIIVTALIGAFLMFAPRREGRMPVTERAIRALIHVAAWLEHIATALDAGLLRYRAERRLLLIELASTEARLAAAVAYRPEDEADNG